MQPNYDMEICSSSAHQSTEEADDWTIQIHALQERVCKIESRLGLEDKAHYRKLCVIDAMDLYEARINYSNEVSRQWSDLVAILYIRMGTERYIGQPIFVNNTIFIENESRLRYKGYKCDFIPFTHCTMISYIGELEVTTQLESVD